MRNDLGHIGKDLRAVLILNVLQQFEFIKVPGGSDGRDIAGKRDRREGVRTCPMAEVTGNSVERIDTFSVVSMPDFVPKPNMDAYLAITLMPVLGL